MILLFALQTAALAADPVTSVWLRASAPGRPGIQSVTVGQDSVTIRSNGLSMLYLGALQSRPPDAERAQTFEFTIPRTPPRAPSLLHSAIIGVFTTGAPIYRLTAGATSVWHPDRMRNSPSAPLLDNLIRDGTRHSPILGYTLAGSPIYGPWAHDAAGNLRRMRSSYRLRAVNQRTHWPNGLELTPSQQGPLSEPNGAFVEDYEFVAGSGDLDAWNGRFAATPEYPHGVYAHYLTTTAEGLPAFPYLAGDPPTHTALSRTDFHFTGSRLEYRLRDKSGALITRLEWTHERPVHLMILSDDLTYFAHIHPELDSHGAYVVDHAFPATGRYHLYADFTVPGSPPTVDHRVLDVTTRGTAPAPPAPTDLTLQSPPRLESGRDHTFTLPLTGEGFEPYLGAWGHFAITDSEHRRFIHAHPIEAASMHDHTKPLGLPPPSISFTVNFPAPGTYKLWAQLQRNGQILVQPFLLQVAAGPAPQTSAIAANATRIAITSAGFTPARLALAPGKHAVAFERSTEPNCGQRIVFPSLGITRDLAPGATTTIHLDITAFTDLTFTCGMGMYRGVIVAAASR